MKKISTKLAAPIFFLVNLLASVQTAIAQNGSTGAGTSTPPPDTSSFSVGSYLMAPGQKNIIESKTPVVAIFIVRLINYLALTIGSFAFLTIVVGGIMMITSAGQEQQITKGKDMIKYAIIGLVVALGAYFITAFVQSIFYEIPTAKTT